MDDMQALLERFRRGAELVAVVATGAAGAELDYRAAPEKWSVRQIMCHLADAEMVGRVRFSRTIAEENPALTAYDEKAWAERLDYHRRKFSQALETFRRVRGENYELLKDQPAGNWLRTAQHSVRGQITLGDLLTIYAEHAESHARQIKEAREAYKASRGR